MSSGYSGDCPGNGGVVTMRQESASRSGNRFGQPGRILCVVGARPNYMKIAPLMHAFAQSDRLERAILVHPGHHYDGAMNGKQFEGLELPAPAIKFERGSAGPAVQTEDI